MTHQDQARVNSMLVRQLTWHELKHALDLNEVKPGASALETGRDIIAVVEAEMERRSQRLVNFYENEARSMIDTEDGIEAVKVAYQALDGGRIQKAREHLNQALRLFNE